MINEHLKLSIEDNVFIIEHLTSVSFDKTLAEKAIEFTSSFLQKNSISKIPVLIKPGNHNQKISYEARKVYSCDTVTCQFHCAAILVKNSFQKFIGELFITINKPKLNIKLFNNEREAFIWLKQHTPLTTV